MNRIGPRRRIATEILHEQGYSDRAIERLIGVHKDTAAKYTRPKSHKRGRPALGEKAKTKILPIRVTEAEHQVLARAAKNCKSLSSWIRRELFKAAKGAKNETETSQTHLLV